MNKKTEFYRRERYYNADMINIHIENLELMNRIMESINVRRISTGRVASSWCLPLFEHLEDNDWRVHMYLGIKENSRGEKVYCDRYCYRATDDIVKRFLQYESLGKAYNEMLKKNPNAIYEPEMLSKKSPDEGFTRIDLAQKAREFKMVEYINQL